MPQFSFSDANVVPQEKGPVAKRYDDLWNIREPFIRRARQMAKLSIPAVLPQEGHSSTSDLQDPYQSHIARGMNVLTGKTLFDIFPMTPWFEFTVAPKFLHNEAIPDEIIAIVMKRLFSWERILRDLSLGSKLDLRGIRRARAFHSQKRQAIRNTYITGDSLEQVCDSATGLVGDAGKYGIKVFRRDQYMVVRDARGEVVELIVLEQIDPFSLTNDQFATSGLRRRELSDKSREKRMVSIYTHAQWMNDQRRWKIDQEINGRQVESTLEPVSPYISTAYSLQTGEPYGRGFIEEQLVGEAMTTEKLAERMIEWAALATKALQVIDNDSEITDEDMERPHGSTIRGRVQNGEVADAAFMKVDKLSDLSLAEQVRQNMKNEIDQSLFAFSPRNAERVTAVENLLSSRELSDATAGVTSEIAPDQQIGTLRRPLFMAMRDNELPPVPERFVNVQLFSGLAALDRERRAQGIEQFMQTAAGFGDQALARLNIDRALDEILRLRGVHVPGFIKSEEELEAEAQAAIRQQTQAAAGQEAVSVVGDTARAQLAPANN